MKKICLFLLCVMSVIASSLCAERIRTFQPKDYSFLIKALYNNEELLYPSNESLARRLSKTQSFLFSDQYITKIFESGNTPLGFITYTRNSSADTFVSDNRLGSIQLLYVDKGYHRQGIGKNLIQYALHDMETKGIKEVRIQTAVDNKAACSLYEKLGFMLLTPPYLSSSVCAYKKLL